MSLSVLSFLVVAVAPGGMPAQMTHKESNAYRMVTPSIASIVRGDQLVGTAALVDSSGLFVAHLECVYGRRISARLSDGRLVTLTLRNQDDPTQLAILQADDWIRTARPLKPVDQLKSGDRLMAVLPSGLIPAEYVGGKSGLVAQSRRLMSLSEISFEAPADKIGGGMIITQSGNLVGFLNASLHSETEANIQIQPSQVEGSDDGPAPAGVGIPRNFAAQHKAIRADRKQGPADMTVAYTPGARVFRRTLESLISGKDVDRPSIGVDVKNAEDHGALIEKVQPGSAADQAGLRAGDVVVEIDGATINDQVDLARIIADEQIGKTLVIKVKRGQTLLIVPVVVGSRPAKTRTSVAAAT